MRAILRKIWEDKRGNSLVIAAATLPLLLGSAGLATDTIQWALWKRQLQRAADSAAIAGVYQYVSDGNNSSVSGAVTKDIGLNNHTNVTMAGGYPQIAYPGDSGDFSKQVKVTLAVQRKLSFSGMFMPNPPLIKTSATAASTPGTDEFCVVTLDKSASVAGIQITGNAAINMDCSFMANSTANNAAYAKGSAEVYANSVAAVGGIQESKNWHVDSYEPYSPNFEDPYKNLDPSPGDMKCAGSWVKQGNKNVWTPTALTETTDVANAKDINGDKANCFSSLSVGSNKSLSLPAGDYYINGGDAFIQGNLSCTSCAIILTNKDSGTIGQFKVNASSEINLSAANSGKFAGIAIMQDRRAGDVKGNKINGNSNSKIQGAIYFPSQEIEYNGTGNTTAVCTQFVSKRINFSGNSGTSNKFDKGSNCTAFGMNGLQGGRRVRLVG